MALSKHQYRLYFSMWSSWYQQYATLCFLPPFKSAGVQRSTLLCLDWFSSFFNTNAAARRSLCLHASRAFPHEIIVINVTSDIYVSLSCYGCHLCLPSSPLLHALGHAKEAVDLARMQEQTTHLEYQSKIKVSQNTLSNRCSFSFWAQTCQSLISSRYMCSFPLLLHQEYEAAVEQLKGDQIRIQAEERRKTLNEETKQNQAVRENSV